MEVVWVSSIRVEVARFEHTIITIWSQLPQYVNWWLWYWFVDEKCSCINDIIEQAICLYVIIQTGKSNTVFHQRVIIHRLQQVSWFKKNPKGFLWFSRLWNLYFISIMKSFQHFCRNTFKLQFYWQSYIRTQLPIKSFLSYGCFACRKSIAFTTFFCFCMDWVISFVRFSSFCRKHERVFF